MEGLIIILSTVFFCSGLLIIFKLHKNSKNILINVENLYDTENIEKTNTLNVQQVISTSFFSEIVKSQHFFIHQVLNKYNGIRDNLSELHKWDKIKNKTDFNLLKQKIDIAISSLDEGAEKATAEMNKISEYLQEYNKIIQGEPLYSNEIENPIKYAAERIKKLRTLSFRLNLADPNNEFDSIPAYIRRNLELYNAIADVEAVYNNLNVNLDKDDDASSTKNEIHSDKKKPE